MNADVPVEKPITASDGRFSQSANIDRVKRRLMENVDFVEAARWIYAYLTNTHFRVDDYNNEMQGSDSDTEITTQLTKNIESKWKFRWHIVLKLLLIHVLTICAIYNVLTTGTISTLLWGLLYGQLTYVGVTGGAHRLWSHRAFKATWQLRLLLMLMHTTCGQNHIYDWVRDHRLHHKYTDTNADPYSAHRGFFFAHIGWLLIRKHPDVINKGKLIDMSDIENDPIVMFQKKYYLIIMAMLCIVLPPIVPWYFWNAHFLSSYVDSTFRVFFYLHITLMINSFAHFYGCRPYNNDISARQNKMVGYLAMGEGWHNYHHVFPWDYKSAELPNFGSNGTVAFIHLMANIGWAYDLKSVPLHLVAKRALRTGDGSPLEQTSATAIPNDQPEDDGHCQILFRKNK